MLKKVLLKLRVSSNVVTEGMLKKLFFAATFAALLISGIGQGEALAQETIKVSGTVTEAESGEALPGVNIAILGTTRGTISNVDGYYELNVTSLQDTLQFSFLGFQAQLIPINGRTQIDVQLQPEVISGSEVVVIGYGTQKQEDSAISSTDLASPTFCRDCSRPATRLFSLVAIE